MDKQQRSVRRRVGLVVTALIGVVGIGTAALAPPAFAVANVTPGRIAGTNRFETAAKLATAAFPNGAATVILANGRVFPDALAGSALGGAKNAPLLLTELLSTPAETTAALGVLKPTTVYLLGGTAAISQAQQDELAKTYAVKRVAGIDRFATAAAIADEIGPLGIASLTNRRTAFIATGLSFADALAGGPLAAAGAGATGVHPVLLVGADVPAATDSALTRLAIQQVVVLGGTAAVSQAVADRLAARTGNPVVRYAGVNRYDTAAKVAQAGLGTYGLGASEVLLASGADFADALAAGPFGFKRTSPLVLTEPNALPGATSAFLEDNSGAVQTVTAIGGTAAVSAKALTQAQKAAETPSNDRQNEGIQVSPQAAETVANDGTRAFVATGMNSPTVDIVLVPCGQVSTAGGNTEFTNSNGGTVADRTHRAGATPPAQGPDDADVPKTRISSVNGTPTTEASHRDDYANNVTPVNGVVSFEIAGPGVTDTTSVTCVIPVVFQDTNADSALNVGPGNPARPSERFGTGGNTTFGPAAAPAGSFAVNVTGFDLAANTFTGCALNGTTAAFPEVANGACTSFAWDATDAFQLGETSTPSNQAQFESLLSIGDDVAGTYAPGAVSTFRLIDEVPIAPTGVNATPGAAAPGGTATVTWTASASATTTGYAIYRSARLAASGDACPAFGSGYTRVNPVADTASPYTDSPILLSGAYCYAVTALNANNGSAESGPSNIDKAIIA